MEKIDESLPRTKAKSAFRPNRTPISSAVAPPESPAPRSRRQRPHRGSRAASPDEDKLAGPGQVRRTPATKLDRGIVWVREPCPCCAAADNSDRASCHNAGTRRETDGATI